MDGGWGITLFLLMVGGWVGRRRFWWSTKAQTADDDGIGRLFVASTEGEGPCHQSQRRPSHHQKIRSVDCRVGRCWYGHSERGGRSSLTHPQVESVDVDGDTTIAAPKMDAIKPPTLYLPRRTLLKPMHYDYCAIYWVPRCEGSCHGRRRSAVADRFWCCVNEVWKTRRKKCQP
jgi:hypothetical protein